MLSSFTAYWLLSVLLIPLWTNGVRALPLFARRDATPKRVSFTLRRLRGSNDNVHPQVLLQQHINHALTKHARLTGRELPSTEELHRHIAKRLVDLPDYVHGIETLTKRYNVHGFTNPDAPSTGNDDSIGTLQAASGPTDNSAGFTEAEIEAIIANTTAPVQPNRNDTLGLTILSNDVGYTAAISIGTPPREFQILMDSGSADLWVGGTPCTSEDGGGCGNHTFLDNRTSSSFADSGNTWDITYGSGAVQGTKVSDTLNLGQLTLENHQFGVALLESVEFTDDSTHFDGIMGLAPGNISNQGVPTPVEALAQQGLIDEAIVSYKISRASDGLNDGEVTFGALDESKFDNSTLVTIDNISRVGFWEVPVDGVSVDGQDLGISGRSAILDTGTTLILVPTQDAEAIHDAIPGAQPDGRGGFTIPCTTNATIELTIGPGKFSINPADLAFQPLDFNDLQSTCVSGISGGTVGQDNQWLVGDVFLKSAYFSTNVNTNQISLARVT